MVNKVYKRLLEERTKVQDKLYSCMEKCSFKERTFLIGVVQHNREKYEELFKVLEKDMIDFSKENLAINSDEKIENIESEIIEIRNCYSNDEKYFEVEFEDFVVEIEEEEINKYGLTVEDKFKIAIIIYYFHRE